MMAGRPTEKVAKLEDVAPHIRNGDPLTHSGRTFWAYLLRIAVFGDKSHAAITARDDEGLWVIDSCEGRGVTKRPLLEEVKKYPGQWYVGMIRHEFNHNYHRERAVEAAKAMVANKTQYGWGGIFLQYMIHTPVLRIIAYVFCIDRLPLFNNRPFCSQALKRWMQIGSLDPVPRRDEQLCTPQDINQSLAIREWIALVP